VKFDDLDARMRVYETAHDWLIPADVFPVVRLDGRGFTRLTKETLTLDAPFDTAFRDAMASVIEHLMDCGFKVLYGYSQSDEISLLMDLAESAFGRKTRKYLSILAGEASACLSLLLGRIACLDSRISELPSRSLVVDYFRWRQEDARRNALSAYAYWEQRKRGVSAAAAARRLKRLSTEGKKALLAELGIDFDQLPSWQRSGFGVYWETYEKEGVNPRTGESAIALRQRLRRDLEIPTDEDYGRFVLGFLNPSSECRASDLRDPSGANRQGGG
jgi:tRNA(His) 5'-end guanylyltransferase